MRFATLRAALVEGLVLPNLIVEPGPVVPDVPGRCIGLTPVTGPGFQMDGLLDVPGWQVRSIGEQYDYESAESLAWAVDALVAGMNNTQTVQGVRLVTGYRAGGGPTPLLVDDAQRHHFVCSYQFVVPSAVAAP